MEQFEQPGGRGLTIPASEDPVTSGHPPPNVLVPIAAVRVLYSTERRAAEYDILIATAVECLRISPYSLDELAVQLDRVWPGAGIQRTSVEAAMAAAEAAGLVIETGERYKLTVDGLREVERSREWAETTYRITANAHQEKASQALFPISDEEAQLWVGILAYALFTGIASASAAYRGDVQLSGDTLVTPRIVDKEAVSTAINATIPRREVALFLEVMAYEAVDPSAPFGRELVSSITTGYLLHAFLARRDAIRTRQALGLIRGQTVILDTPILFQMLGSDERVRPIGQRYVLQFKQGSTY